MKKVSTASFIVGAVLIVASIALFIFGALSVNTPYAYSRAINGYTYTKVSYSVSITGIINGFMMIIFGGIAFLGGLLSFILAAVTRGPKFPPKPGCGRGQQGPRHDNQQWSGSNPNYYGNSGANEQSSAGPESSEGHDCSGQGAANNY